MSDEKDYWSFNIAGAKVEVKGSTEKDYILKEYDLYKNEVFAWQNYIERELITHKIKAFRQSIKLSNEHYYNIVYNRSFNQAHGFRKKQPHFFVSDMSDNRIDAISLEEFKEIDSRLQRLMIRTENEIKRITREYDKKHSLER